ncbi:hypothetical protein BGW38_008137 [Lunasporangiospora selenospora]|uniref:Thioredoxin n=1 Tax=Lunasporangiospora selenospora TaxID=979761 RepID=A0A9P6FKB1_9FUNG|nr:hypothetical protein BGW38_008137 [Lunasporangiospora selenospora]
MAAKVKEIQTVEEFNALIFSGKKVVASFYADKCGSCKTIGPKFEKLAAVKEYAKIQFVKVNIDKLPDIAKKFVVTATPTFHAFKNGLKVDTLIGAVPAKLDALVEKLSKL